MTQPNPFDAPSDTDPDVAHVRVLRAWKFVVHKDDPIQIGAIVYKDCLALVVAYDVTEARVLAKDFMVATGNPLMSRPVDSMWIDYVEPEEIDISAPRALGVVLG